MSEIPRPPLMAEPIRGDLASAQLLRIARPVGLEFELLAEEPNLDALAGQLPASFGMTSEEGWHFPYGAEFKSPPGYGNVFEMVVVVALEAIKAAGYSATEVGSTHVHVDISDAPDEVETLFAMVSVAEIEALHLLSPDRHRFLHRGYEPQMSYQTRLRSQLGEGQRLTPYITNKPVRRAKETDPVAHFPTLEVRLLQAVDDPAFALAWAAFWQHVVEAALGSPRRDADKLADIQSRTKPRPRRFRAFARAIGLPDEAATILARQWQDRPDRAEIETGATSHPQPAAKASANFSR